MNLQTKLVFALEHVEHLKDLVKGNEYEHHLRRSIFALQFEFERQLDIEKHRKLVKGGENNGKRRTRPDG